jgi:hypothetical protein
MNDAALGRISFTAHLSKRKDATPSASDLLVRFLFSSEKSAL